MRDTGCLFVTSAVESADDAVLEKLEKHHTRADFLKAVELCREIGLTLQPTFVPFTPWTTLENYRELLALLRENDLDRKRGADSTGDSAADSGGVAFAGAWRNARV